MPRVLIINPNRSLACTAGIDAAIARFRTDGGPTIDVVGLPDGPPAILSWQDWHAAVGPLCRAAAREAADVVVVACASDPGIEAVRAVTHRPVLGVFRCAIAAATTRAERFGVVAIVDASKGRHLAALRSMGLEARLAAEVALNVSMETLLDPVAARAGLIRAAQDCVAAGAGAVVLGCTGMAAHRTAIEQACGAPVIEPCEAGAAMALLALQDSGVGLVEPSHATALPA
jgi:Asp/Glu/hydantoin racemase